MKILSWCKNSVLFHIDNEHKILHKYLWSMYAFCTVIIRIFCSVCLTFVLVPLNYKLNFIFLVSFLFVLNSFTVLSMLQFYEFLLLYFVLLYLLLMF